MIDSLLFRIAMAREHLLNVDPEDDGLTEFPFPVATAKDDVCYVDAESATIILDWIESLITGGQK